MSTTSNSPYKIDAVSGNTVTVTLTPNTGQAISTDKNFALQVLTDLWSSTFAEGNNTNTLMPVLAGMLTAHEVPVSKKVYNNLQVSSLDDRKMRREWLENKYDVMILDTLSGYSGMFKEGMLTAFCHWQEELFTPDETELVNAAKERIKQGEYSVSYVHAIKRLPTDEGAIDITTRPVFPLMLSAVDVAPLSSYTIEMERQAELEAQYGGKFLKRLQRDDAFYVAFNPDPEGFAQRAEELITEYNVQPTGNGTQLTITVSNPLAVNFIQPN